MESDRSREVSPRMQVEGRELRGRAERGGLMERNGGSQVERKGSVEEGRGRRGTGDCTVPPDVGGEARSRERLGEVVWPGRQTPPVALALAWRYTHDRVKFLLNG